MEHVWFSNKNNIYIFNKMKFFIKTILVIIFSFNLAIADELKGKILNEASEQISSKLSDLIPGEGITETSISFKETDALSTDVYYSILAVRDIESTEYSNFFTQISLRNQEVNDNTRMIANFGLGYRQLNADKTFMWGVNSFLDGDLRHKHRRLGVGLEAKASLIDLYVNGYQKITNVVTVDNTDEEVLNGYDYSLETQLPYAPWARIGLTGYEWEKIKASQDSDGIIYFTDFKINPSLDFGISVDKSNLASVEDVWEAELNFIYPPREKTKTMMDGTSTIAFERENMEAKLREKVKRKW